MLYDLEVNPNRPDAMSVAGVARDLAARLGVPFTLPSPAVEGGRRIASIRTVEGRGDPTCAAVRRPGAARRLGRPVRPGHRPPAHAARHAADQLAGRRVELRDARAGPAQPPLRPGQGAGRGCGSAGRGDGEALVTLDDVERTFTGDDLLICDGEDRPIGIAGVMGGAETEIDETTTDVLVEMAWFLPIAVAKTSRRLRLRSEASARFEKGTDPEVIDLAQRRFAELLAGSGARLEAGTVDVRGELPDRRPCIVRTERLNRLLGTTLTARRDRRPAGADRLRRAGHR